MVDACIRQPQDETHIPYTQNNIPGVIYLSDYDLGTNGIAYYDVDSANYSLSTDQYQAWNSGWNYRNDGVDIQTNTDNTNSNGFHIAYTKDKEWLRYTVNIGETGFYNLNFRYATQQSGAKVKLFLNDVDIAGNINLGNTGGWSNFVNHNISNLYLKAGTQVLKVQVDGNSEFNMSSLDFFKSTETPTFHVLSASTNEDEKSINVIVNYPLETQILTNDLFEIKVNNVSKVITSVEIDDSNNRLINIKLEDYLYYKNDIKLSYKGDSITSIDNQNLNPFQNLLVENNIITRVLIPGKIQAEEFFNQSGLEIENTTDTGLGQNIAYTDVGDYAEYLIYISDSGNYNLDVRTAAQSNSGKIELELIQKDNTSSMSIIDLPVTGGWQSWQTKSAKVALNAGIYTLKMKVLESGFNINWLEFKFESSLKLNNSKINNATIFPNPVLETINIKLNNNQTIKSLKIIDVSGRTIKKMKPSGLKGVYNFSSLKTGLYIIMIETDNGILQKKIFKI